MSEVLSDELHFMDQTGCLCSFHVSGLFLSSRRRPDRASFVTSNQDSSVVSDLSAVGSVVEASDSLYQCAGLVGVDLYAGAGGYSESVRQRRRG
jgi:hypothetical protein